MRTKTKLKSESALFVAVLFGILVLVNLIGVRFFARADLTRDKIHSLSKASTALVSNLPDKLVVKAYFTKNLPGRYASLERQVRDLLDGYKNRSNGKMQVEFIDPTGDEEAEKVAKSLGIQKMPNPDIDKDQATVKEGYRGISFSFGEKTEVIPAVESPVGLEYDVTTSLKEVLGRKPELGFLVGHGEPEIEPPPDQNQQQMMEDPSKRGAFRSIRQNLTTYVYRQLDLGKGDVEIPSEMSAIVVVGSGSKLDEKELYRLDQFLLSGKSIAFFVSGTNVQTEPPPFPGMPPSYRTSANDTGLAGFLAHHGIKLGDDLVFDAQAADFVSMCQPIPLPFPRPYPAWPLVTQFGKSHPITHRLGSLTFPYVSSVRAADKGGVSAGRQVQEIAFSSGTAWTSSPSSAVVDPCAVKEGSPLESGIPLAAVASGTFTSFWSGKTPPDLTKTADGKPVDKPAPAFIEKSRAPGRLVVVGSPGLPADEILSYLARSDRRQALGNFTFVQNVLDWMTNDEDLIAVRMKNVDDPPLAKASDTARAFAKYGNIIGIPLAFILFGVIRWRLRSGRGGAKKAA
ncbi:MAG: GldG family protein [Deltaproteobacteria bacterium]|nr:GldG family protein [Deltaproteobacteria bacterium]